MMNIEEGEIEGGQKRSPPITDQHLVMVPPVVGRVSEIRLRLLQAPDSLAALGSSPRLIKLTRA
jgi:hypothetical protein